MKRKLYVGLFFMLLSVVSIAQVNEQYTFVYNLHGQTRRYDVNIKEVKDTVRFEWSTLRNSVWLKGCYKMGFHNIQEGKALSWLQPIDGSEIVLPDSETFGIVSRKALQSLKDNNSFTYNGIIYRKVNDNVTEHKEYKGKKLIHVLGDFDLTNMWIIDDKALPLIYKVTDNPLGIDWTIE